MLGGSAAESPMVGYRGWFAAAALLYQNIATCDLHFTYFPLFRSFSSPSISLPHWAARHICQKKNI